MERTVLFISFFHPEIVRGGSQQVAYELFKATQDTPNTRAVLLCSCDPAGQANLLKSGAFITGFDGRENEFLFFGHGFDFFYQRALNPQAMIRLAEFFEEVNPDVIHFHHSLFIGMDAIAIARRVCPDATILYTLHEFVPICHANGQMIRAGNNGLCSGASQYRCHECFPDVSPDFFWARKEWMLNHFEMVDRFIAPTRFLKNRYVEWGLPENRLHVIPNGQTNLNISDQPSQDAGSHDRPRNRFAFFGQVLDNKGLHVLLKAADILVDREVTDFHIDIYGGNIEYATEAYRNSISTLTETLKENEFTNVRWRGRYDHAQLPLLMSQVDWVVVPSVWWEIFGLVVSEAWMFGKPVLASNIGGLQERVNEQSGGMVFNPDDAHDLANLMERCLEEPELWVKLHQNTRPPISSSDAWSRHEVLMTPNTLILENSA